jgi:hypothetical protein
MFSAAAHAGFFFTSHNDRIKAITDFMVPADEFKFIILNSAAAQLSNPAYNLPDAVAQEITMHQLVAHKKLSELFSRDEIQVIYDTQRISVHSKFHWTSIKFMVRVVKHLNSASGQAASTEKNTSAYSPTEDRLFALFIPQNRLQQNLARTKLVKQLYIDKMRENFSPQEMAEVLRIAEEPLMQRCKSIFDNLRVQEYRAQLPENGVPASVLGWGSGWGWHWGWRR